MSSVVGKNKYLIAIVGPTASGKTKIGIELAKHFQTEIISADSRQMYRQMNIGTAKPTISELQEAEHHFVNNLDIWAPYSAGDFERDAMELLAELHKKHDVVILVGGSGLFVKALAEGFDNIPEAPAELRETLNKRLKEDGLETLQKQLFELDPIQYEQMDIQNHQRVIRALEVCISSGKPYSSFKNSSANERPFETITVGINRDRDLLYNRINQRVDIMMSEGLEEEVKSLLDYQSTPVFNTVGYQEFLPYFQREIDLAGTVELIKRNSRRYAKRQITWFKKTKDIIWSEPDINKILSEIKTKLKA